MSRAARSPQSRIDALTDLIDTLKTRNARLLGETRQYRRLFDSLPVSVYVIDRDGIITDVNPFHVEHMGRGKLKREDYLGKLVVTRDSLVEAGLAERFQLVLKGTPLTVDGAYFPSVSGGGDGYFNIRGVPLKRGVKIVGAIFISEDVTMLKKAQAELTIHKERLEELVQARTAELRSALAKVKTLSGFLPICASCKKVRDDQGYWQQVEAYLTEHSEIELSHGLCPDCLRKLYPDLGKEQT